jgi:hypothetical protein
MYVGTHPVETAFNNQAVSSCVQVYVHYSELLNFLRAMVSLLSLPPDAGPSAVMAALAKLVEQAARWVLRSTADGYSYSTLVL